MTKEKSPIPRSLISISMNETINLWWHFCDAQLPELHLCVCMLEWLAYEMIYTNQLDIGKYRLCWVEEGFDSNGDRNDGNKFFLSLSSFVVCVCDVHDWFIFQNIALRLCNRSKHGRVPFCFTKNPGSLILSTEAIWTRVNGNMRNTLNFTFFSSINWLRGAVNSK